jgi:serine/threonine-protein kinase
VAGTGGGESQGYPQLGSMFGRYRIESIIGRGGMGVVFRATDAALERVVALKFLAPQVADDPAFQARFLRESRLAAAIEHPNMVPIYEAGEFDGIAYIAMRYVPGQDLSTVLRAEAPLAVERALAIVEGLASALDAAHRRGLVHRDVKPGNVLLESDGTERTYLVDFGLTRRAADTLRLNTGGMLGTIDYMAPEQIEGGIVDGRADQYALACLLFHCLAGSPPFGDLNDAAVLYGHVHRERPLLSSQRPDLGTTFDATLARGMARNPDDRFDDCRAFSAAAQTAWLAAPRSAGASLATKSVPAGGPPAGSEPRSTSMMPTSSREVVAGGTRSRSRWARRAAVPVALVLGGGAVLAGVMLLPRAAPGVEATSSPNAPGSPTQIAAETGQPTAIVTLAASQFPQSVPPSSNVPSPRADGEIVFASNYQGQYDLFRINPDGSDLRAIGASTPRDERMAAISPDGRRIAFAAGSEGARDLYVMNADGSGLEQITTHPTDDRYPAWSPDGNAVAFASDRSGNLDIWLLQDGGTGLASGKLTQLTSERSQDQYPTWSPDGRRLAYSHNLDATTEIWVMTVANPFTATVLKASPVAVTNPVWSPDGDSIAYVKGRFVSDRDVFLMDADGKHEVQLTHGGAEDFHPAWSPDSSLIAFASGQFTSAELFIMPRKGGDAPSGPRSLTTSLADADDPSWGMLEP